MTVFLPLAEAGPDCGGKAETLGRLIRAGFDVPDGVVLPVSVSEAGQWDAELDKVLRQLGGTSFAVRSSAVGEDGMQASFAGQFRTTLDVSPDGVAAAITATLIQHGNADAYAVAVAAPPHRGIAVIVQRMVAAEVAGVTFTRHPLTGDRATVIEAVRGLGEPLVSGTVSPQPDALTSDQTHSLTQLAERVEALLGGGQDIEWAIGEGRTWIVQARPITATADHLSSLGEPRDRSQVITAAGTPAAPGVATGPLRIVRSLDDFAEVHRGDVLVCRTTSPAWMPVLARAAAVITEQGGILAHAAIVARELGIPAVTDVLGATDGFPLASGANSRVDGTAGTIQVLDTDTTEGRVR